MDNSQIMVKLILCDFDGVLTNIAAEAPTYARHYKEGLRDLLDISRTELDKLWEMHTEEILRKPSEYGWKIDGKIVAPAYANIHILCEAIAQHMLSEVENPRSHALRLYRESYKKTPTVFRKRAADLLSMLETKVCMVSNSSTDNVKSKLSQLGFPHIPVYGDSHKHLLVSGWDEVLESVDEGFGRPLYLRRKDYWNVVSKIMAEKQVKPEQVLVIGDIYEFDLLLAKHMGMNIISLPGKNVPDFEISAVADYEKGFAAESLGQIIEYIT